MKIKKGIFIPAKKVEHFNNSCSGSVEIIVFHNVLGVVCCSIGKSKLEKILKKIFDSLRPRHCGSPPCDTRRKPVHHGSLVLM